MLILNTGGTFNKRYNPISGTLDVPYDNHAVEAVLKALHVSHTPLAGVVYKDSLQMTSDDRKMIANIILQSEENVFIVIHAFKRSINGWAGGGSGCDFYGRNGAF